MTLSNIADFIFGLNIHLYHDERQRHAKKAIRIGIYHYIMALGVYLVFEFLIIIQQS